MTTEVFQQYPSTSFSVIILFSLESVHKLELEKRGWFQAVAPKPKHNEPGLFKWWQIRKIKDHLQILATLCLPQSF